MKNGLNGAPWWARLLVFLGLPAFLLLWVLGAFGRILPSPVTAAVEAHHAATVQESRETARLLRLMCRALYRGDDGGQRECDR